MTAVISICVFWGISLIEGVLSKDACYNWYDHRTYYCDYGCCGDDWDRGCCSIAGIIVGACIGGIVLIAVLVAVICCCMKHKGKAGRVIGTEGTSTVATVNTTYYTAPPAYGAQPYGQPYGQPYPSGTVPPPYPVGPPTGPPPSQGLYNDPAYPPSTAPPPYT